MASQALEAAHAAIARWAEDKDPLDAPPVLLAQARALMAGYDARWSGAGWQLAVGPINAAGEEGQQVEQEFLLPILNPETGEQHSVFLHAGKYDGKVLFEGRKYLLEHKTASEDIADPHAPYWRRLAIDAQVSAYNLASWQDADRLEGTLYDVIRKPTIRPRILQKKDIYEITHSGSYFGIPVDNAEIDGVGYGLIKDESPDLYERRLTHKYVEEKDAFFGRRTIARTDREVLEFSNELWQLTQELEYTRTHNAHYRNSGACMAWGRACEYLGICSGHESAQSDRWRAKETLHTELPLVSAEVGASRDVLTYSRMSCFKSCKRKHQLRYEIGLERVDKQDDEALRFGSVVHEALEAWWRCQ